MNPGETGHVCTATGKQEVLEKHSGLCRGCEGPEMATGRGLYVPWEQLVQVSHGLGLGRWGHPEVPSFETRGQRQPGSAISTHSPGPLWGRNQTGWGLNFLPL